MVLFFRCLLLINVPFEKVLVHYGLLSSDIALVFDLVDNHVRFCIVLFVSNVLFMPVNCLFCADYDVVRRMKP